MSNTSKVTADADLKLKVDQELLLNLVKMLLN